MFEELSPPYSTIVADPPWAYQQQAGRIITTANKTVTRPDLQYSRMTIADICALPVADLATRDAHLYLWATNPLLDEAFDVMRAWGFRYVTLITWLKSGTLGMGYYFRGETEHLLFGLRGKLPIPPNQRQRNWIEAPRQGHSVKPPAFSDLIESVSPGPYLELFARQPRLGWDSWGYGYEQAAS